MQDNKIKNKENIWDTFAIGSDFDGFINPVDAFISANEFKDLDYYLVQAFSGSELFRKYSNDSPTLIVDKILFKNAFNFLIKHYWENENIT